VKKSLLVVVTVALAASVAMATETRVFTLGQSGAFLLDDTNVYPWPSRVVGYGNEVIAELCDYPVPADHSGQYVTGFFAPDEEMTYGVFGIGVNRQPATYGWYATLQGLQNFGDPDYVPILVPDERVDFFWGMGLDGVAIGARLEWAGDASKQDTDGAADWDQSSMIIGGAASATVGLSDEMDLDIGGEFAMNSWSAEAGEYTFENDGGMGFGGNARLRWMMNDYATLVPVVMFHMVDMGYNEKLTGATSETYDLSAMDFSGGVALEWALFDETTVVLGLHGGMMSQTWEDPAGNKMEWSALDVPGVIIAAETTVWDWLVGRVGAHKQHQWWTDKSTYAVGPPDEVEETGADAPFNLTGGVGIRWGDFQFDAQVNDNFIYEGPYFIGGANADGGGNQPFVMMSATYNFSGLF